MSDLLRRDVLKLLASAALVPMMLTAGCRSQTDPWGMADVIFL